MRINNESFDIPQVIKLRPAQFSDYAAIASLHAENWRQNYRGILSDHYLDNEVEKDRKRIWKGRLESPVPDQRVTVALMDGGIVGFCCYFLDEDPVYGTYLDNLHVSANLQKSGIGRILLVECAKSICNHAKTKNMYLWVYESSKNARNMYERLRGVNADIVEKVNESGTKASVCRYVWDDVSKLLDRG